MADEKQERRRKKKAKKRQRDPEEAAAAGGSGGEGGGEAGEDENWMKSDPALSMIKFRNYVPRDDNLKFFQLPKPKVEPLVTEEEIKALGEPIATENGIMDIAPKKANWDLKRDVARKVARLDKRTQRAIIDLIREKVEGGGDLTEQIEHRQKEAEMDSDDD